jgi:hypothetical protein
MKKLYSFSFLLLIYLNVSWAQTNVSGFINANTIWNIAGSPYIVVGSIIVNIGYTLTIDPGVVVKFDSAKALRIDGELIANGTAANRIIFTANQSTPVPGRWAGILFSDTSIDAQYNTNGDYISGSIMRFCDVLYGGGGGLGIIHALESYPHVSNCTIGYSSSAGIYCENTLITADSCCVKNCTGIGVEVNNGLSRICNWKMLRDTIEYNSGGGLIIWGASCQTTHFSVTVLNCYFKNDSGAGGIYIPSIPSVISNNIFENITGSTVGVGSVICISKANFTIECNLFRHCYSHNNISLVWVGMDIPGPGIVRNNVFEDNLSDSPTGHYTALDVFITQPRPIYIRRNIFRNNNDSAGHMCALKAFGSGNFYSHFHVDSNEFHNNKCLADIQFNLGPSFIVAHVADFNYNNFMDDSASYALYNSNPFDGADLYADSNYWNSTSVQHIDSAIYDSTDNSNQSIVYYNPVLMSRVSMGEPCAPVIILADNYVRNELNYFIIYPNPAFSSGTFTISFNKEPGIRNRELGIYDLAGRLVYMQILNQKSEIINKIFSPGIYFIKVNDGERWETKKLIIQ